MAQMQEVKVRHTFVRGAVLSALMFPLSFIGCAFESVTTEDAAPVEASTQKLVDPNGVYFADVTAMGSGCMPGTWSTTVSDDGLVFTTVFSEYQAEVDIGIRAEQKDCQLAVTLHTPSGISFSVEKFTFAGSAFLESGVNAQQSASYYFQGNRVNALNVRTRLSGPFDGDYVYDDNVLIADRVWSPCGTERDLNIATRLRVLNRANRSGFGYINTLSVDGSVELVFRLGRRTC